MSQSNQFIPQADRPAYQASDFIETSEDTLWHNPLEYDVAVQLHVGSEGKRASTLAEDQRWAALPETVRREKRTGIRTYVIKAKATRSIPSEFDMAIQQYQCAHPECLGSKGLYCKDRSHAEYKTVVAGLYPRLINKGTQSTPIRKNIPIHWALDDQAAKKQIALEEAKRKLAEAQNARDAFLIAQGDLASAQAEISKAESDMASHNATTESAAHADAIAKAGGGGEPTMTDAQRRAAIAHKK